MTQAHTCPIGVASCLCADKQAMPDCCMLHSCPKHTASKGRVCLQQANESATEVALMMYRSEVRRLLLEYRGYECSVSLLGQLTANT